ncbi:YdeI/OmpD-associated family protein [Paraflavitalea pollutisoli]|uniref:YdeI/OmpD-associated family protein n=1 Tax=Paraflavitalea pollutisoli TaxID=3034143 RepID=UPI0023EC35AB|nr:YdeI/OmpD-associated family protein [Paraflavitalea sp. H1-2-19X]
MEKPLVNKKYILQRMPGKGGWTYIVIKEITREQRGKRGVVQVRGFIDTYEIKALNLMPMANGAMFMPVKAAIRKEIKKGEGDSVKLVLFAHDAPLDIPEELLDCLRDEPRAHKAFFALPEGEQKLYIDWIYAAKKEETRVDRMAEAINRVSRGLTLRQKSGDE